MIIYKFLKRPVKFQHGAGCFVKDAHLYDVAGDLANAKLSGESRFTKLYQGYATP